MNTKTQTLLKCLIAPITLALILTACDDNSQPPRLKKDKPCGSVTANGICTSSTSYNFCSSKGTLKTVTCKGDKKCELQGGIAKCINQVPDTPNNDDDCKDGDTVCSSGGSALIVCTNKHWISQPCPDGCEVKEGKAICSPVPQACPTDWKDKCEAGKKVNCVNDQLVYTNCPNGCEMQGNFPVCKTPENCPADFKDRCDGTIAKNCVNGNLQQVDCAANTNGETTCGHLGKTKGFGCFDPSKITYQHGGPCYDILVDRCVDNNKELYYCSVDDDGNINELKILFCDGFGGECGPSGDGLNDCIYPQCSNTTPAACKDDNSGWSECTKDKDLYNVECDKFQQGSKCEMESNLGVTCAIRCAETNVPDYGECSGALLYYCDLNDDNELVTFEYDCAKDNLACGYDAEKGLYDCIPN